jgi:hypothetical protein
MKEMENDLLEIGHGVSAGMLRASRAELDRDSQWMNDRW